MGQETCDFVAKGATNDEVKSALMAHAMEAHPNILEGKSDEEKAAMDKMMDEKITE